MKILMQISRVNFLNLLFCFAMLAGCASTQYTEQRPASLPVGDMLVTVGEGWMSPHNGASEGNVSGINTKSDR